MVAERREIDIDIDNLAGWEKLTDELDQYPDGVVLRRGGRRIARLLPEDDWDPDVNLSPEVREKMASIQIMDAHDVERLRDQPMTQEQADRMLAAATALGKLLDLDEMRHNVEESRRLSIALRHEKDREHYGDGAQ